MPTRGGNFSPAAEVWGDARLDSADGKTDKAAAKIIE